jgi:hypothetical protein
MDGNSGDGPSGLVGIGGSSLAIGPGVLPFTSIDCLAAPCHAPRSPRTGVVDRIRLAISSLIVAARVSQVLDSSSGSSGALDPVQFGFGQRMAVSWDGLL